MPKLPEYQEVSEKAKYFNNGAVKINVNIESLFDTIQQLVETGDFVFRGCSEAKYKLFNSAQRFYIGSELYNQAHATQVHDHYDQFIGRLIEECKVWNQSTVKNLLKASGIDEENALAYLSYMQHFGVPTPLLDFTYDPYQALFFAIDNLSYNPSDLIIDNYFSLYWTYQNATAFDGWRHAFNKTGKNLAEGKIKYEEVAQNSMHILLPTDEAYKILNNTNIINQKGLFFYSNSPHRPLEEVYFEFAAEMKKQLGDEKFKEILAHETLANCVNIHKSLAPYIEKKLAEKGITRDFVYPDPWKMKTSALKNATVSSLTLRQ